MIRKRKLRAFPTPHLPSAIKKAFPRIYDRKPKIKEPVKAPEVLPEPSPQKPIDEVLKADSYTLSPLIHEITYTGKKKVAICFSGLLKNFHQTLPNLVERIINCNPDCDFDIYFHIWDQLDVRFVDKYSHIKITSEDLKLINDILSSNNIKFKIVQIEDFIDFDTSSYSKYIKPEDIHADHKEKRGNHILSQFYKLKKCNDLKINNEKYYKFTYDVVIRARADLIFDNDVKLGELDLDIIWIPGKIKIGWADHFAISSSANIDYLCNLWTQLNNIVAHTQRFNPHIILTYYLERKKVEVLRINNCALRITGDIVRFFHE